MAGYLQNIYRFSIKELTITKNNNPEQGKKQDFKDGILCFFGNSEGIVTFSARKQETFVV